MNSNNQRIYRIITKLPGFLTEESFELFILLGMYNNTVNQKILEIGVFCGRSLLALSYAFKNSSLVVGVDPMYENFFNSPAMKGEDIMLYKLSRGTTPAGRINNINYVKNELSDLIKLNLKIKLVRKTQDEFFKDSNIKFNIIHVDGEHTYSALTNFLNNLDKHIDHGGMIIFDDIINPGVPGIAEAIFGHHYYKNRLFPVCYGFNKGVFLYKPNNRNMINLIKMLTTYYENNKYVVKNLEDKSIVVEKIYSRKEILIKKFQRLLDK